MIPGVGTEVEDFFEADKENFHYGIIPFLRWGANVDKIELYREALEAWQQVLVDLNKLEWVTGLEAQNAPVDILEGSVAYKYATWGKGMTDGKSE